MQKRRSLLLGIALTVLGGAVALFSPADTKPAPPGSRFGGDVERAAVLIREKKIVSVGQALACVPKHAHGQLLQVAFREASEEAGGRPVYELFVLGEDNQIWGILLDATTGEVLLRRPEGRPAKAR